MVRISGADLVDGSSTAEETLTFAGRLAAEGADALNVGIGWHESAIPTVQAIVPPAAWVGYAEAVKAAVGTLPVIASNRITSVALAERVLRESTLDFVSMARPFLADPALVRKAAQGDVEPTNLCIACNQACIDRSLIDADVSCMVNPRAGRELAFPLAQRAVETLRFAVVGGGPGGLEAARALATLGHRVELFEAGDELGGQFRLARVIPGKRDYGATIRFFSRELARLGVVVHLERPVTLDDVELLRAFDGVVLASGVVPRRTTIPGAELAHVVGYADAIRRHERLGARVAIVGGGGIGVDIAHLLSDDPAARRQVTVLRRGRAIGDRIGRSTRWAILQTLRAHGVRLAPNVRYERIVEGGIVVRDAEGVEELVEADNVVIAIGQERNDTLRPLLERLEIPHRVIGGAAEPVELDAVRAFDEGLRAAHDLVQSRADARRRRAFARLPHDAISHQAPERFFERS
jgi:2,4-dienoyl-CoA reductase (NADPH2)